MKHEWQKTTELEYSDTRGQQEQSVLVEYDTKFKCQRCGQIFRTGPGSRGVQFFMREQKCKGEES